MKKRMFIMLVIVLLILGLVFGWYGFRKYMFTKFMSSYQPPPITITASVAKTKTWQPYFTSVGTLKAVNGVDVSSEASGIVRDIRFKSGDLVTQGTVLVVLDTTIEEASLKNDQSQLKLAQLNYNRSLQLANKNFLSQSELDTTRAKMEQTESQVEVDNAKIAQKTVRAPFAGKIGINLTNLGQYMPAGSAMVTLQALDPLRVEFSLPEQDLPYLKIDQPAELKVSAYNDQPFAGTITAINSKVDQSTRSVLVQATIPNKENRLYPGMFASVKVQLPEQKEVITLPQTAISYSLYGDSVYLIKQEGKDKDGKAILHVYRQYVVTGERRDNEVAILKGLKSGDTVVSSGQLKLDNGAVVVIDNSTEL